MESHSVGVGNDAELISKTLQVEHKLFYFDLKDNPRGRYLKISEKTSNNRSTIILPSNGISWFLNLFNYYLNSDDHESFSKELHLDSKVFYFDVGENPRGRFLKVSEASMSRNRSNIIIPAGTNRDEGWLAFRDILAEINDALGLFMSNQVRFHSYTRSEMENVDGAKLKRVVFVTVGTTLFDSLVTAVDTPEVKQELYAKGYTHLLIQIGRGSYIPSRSTGEDGSLAVDYFTFSSSIADSLKSASLVISHAGSGSIFETLRLRKTLIVVVNEDLMDNHQAELAEELAERKHLFCSTSQTLYQTVASMNIDSLLPYPPGDAKPVSKLINKFLGFPED